MHLYKAKLTNLKLHNAKVLKEQNQSETKFNIALNKFIFQFEKRGHDDEQTPQPSKRAKSGNIFNI